MAPVGRLSVSILSADFARLAEEVKVVEPYADVIHIDVMDAHFVPPLTIGPVVVASLRPVTGLTFNCHLMVERPESLFEDLASAGTDMVTFHVEAQPDPMPSVRKARDLGMLVGLAVSPDTPIEEVYPHLDELDEVIVMSVYPGWAGQRFLEEAVPKIAALRAEVDGRGLGLDIEVDGGVNEETGRRCVEAGATILTAASAIYASDDPAAAARSLAALSATARRTGTGDRRDG
jgi:ribulose-phosphate 3-epimerase